MKKILFLVSLLIVILLGSLFLAGCSKEDGNNITYTHEPSTQCYIETTDAKLSIMDFVDRLTKTDIQEAYFYIRIDNSIPDAGSFSPSQYYPNSVSGSPREFYNKGSINTKYDWLINSSSIKYVYDPTGKICDSLIVTKPDFNNILKKSGVNINTDSLKVIWYTIKYESNFWHVDGVLTDKSNTEIPDTDKDTIKTDTLSLAGHVEVDVHQQQHSDWNEVKTSVHIRDYVDSVKISIPIESRYICESDDMNIRHYEYFNRIDSLSTNQYVQVTVKHDVDNIEITIHVDPAYTKSLLDKAGDGVTVEIHNYIKDLMSDEIWKKLKGTTVTTYKKTTIKGQITSAFYKDSVVF